MGNKYHFPTVFVNSVWNNSLRLFAHHLIVLFCLLPRYFHISWSTPWGMQECPFWYINQGTDVCIFPITYITEHCGPFKVWAFHASEKDQPKSICQLCFLCGTCVDIQGEGNREAIHQLLVAFLCKRNSLLI